MDKELVRQYYQRMEQDEFARTITAELSGLTAEALEIISEEIARRKLDPALIDKLVKQHELDNTPELFKVYDKDACPVDEPVRLWMEEAMLYLLDLFGKEHVLSRKILLPIQSHFPARFDYSENYAREALKIVAGQMEVPFEKIKLDFIEEELRRITDGTPGGMYWGEGQDGRFEISLARTLLDEPEKMIATLAHEIAHIKLLGENRITDNDELLTELTTIFFGMGVFNANAAFETFYDERYLGWSQAGYLSQLEWGYALSLFAYLRKEEQPEWYEHLCANLKGDFRQGMNFIRNNEAKIFAGRRNG